MACAYSKTDNTKSFFRSSTQKNVVTSTDALFD